MDRWVGKVAVVTGAGRGIGAATAEKLVKAGLHVVGFDLHTEQLEENAKKLSDEKGKLIAVKADMSKEKDIIKAIKWTVDNVGPISILINNAGIHKDGGMLNETAADFKEILDINVLGLCIATKEVIHNMKAHQIEGHIIHMNSLTGHQIPDILRVPNLGLYAASKHAVTALNDVLRIELNSEKDNKIKVTSISPGFVRTNLTKDIHNSGVPLLNPEDIADTIVIALSTPPHVLICDIKIAAIKKFN